MDTEHKRTCRACGGAGQVDPALPEMEARVKVYTGTAGKESSLRAFADVIIAGAFIIRGLRVLEAKAVAEEPARLFVAFPSRRGTGEQADMYFEIAHPITAEARAAVRDLVLAAYADAVKEAQP